jgi:DNA repair exonuclease SbcCD ATPase subunit
MNELAQRTPVLIAAEINSIKEQTQRMFLLNSIEIGRRLVEVKSMLPHGDWGNWLEESVDYSQRTATNLMKIFEQYGDSQLSLFGSDAKSQALANLSYTQAVALLGVPQDDREKFIKDNDVENMSTRELQQAIKDKQELERQLKESEKRTKEIEDQAKKEQIAREKIENEYKKLEIQNKDHALIVQKLKSDLESAKTAGDDDEIERLQSSLNKTEGNLSESQKRIKDLERQLKEKPIDVPAIVEKVPEAIEQELADLREKVAKQSSNKTLAKFSFCFESIVSDFNDLLATLDQIEDTEITNKYKSAVKGLINKMSERL